MMEKEKYYICYFLYYADINKKTTNWTFQNECTLYVPFFITLTIILIIKLLWSIKWGILSRYNF